MSNALLVKPSGAMLASQTGTSEHFTTSQGQRVREDAGCAAQHTAPLVPPKVVRIDVAASVIGSFVSIPESELRELLATYDVDEHGGLTQQQWKKFCSENQKRFTQLSDDLLNFELLGECSSLTRGWAPAAGELMERRSFLQVGIGFLEGFAAGGIAGAVSKTVIAPGDRVKIIFQVDSKRTFSLMEAFRLSVRNVREHGMLALWTGNGATMMRVVPYAAITYVSFDYYHGGLKCIIDTRKANGSGEDDKKAVSLRFLGGAMAGATATAFTYPLDMMRARFAASSCNGPTLTYKQAYYTLVTNHGWKAMYSGLGPTLVGIMPYAGFSFACFETIKHYIVVLEGLESDKEISTSQRLIAGGFSGLLAQSMTYPLDIVRRRMQVTPGRYHSILHALFTIAKEEGLKQGLYKGLTMNWIKGPIAVGVSFTVNDVLKKRMERYYQGATKRAKSSNVITVPEAFVCGGIAAGLAKLWTTPFDRLKIMYQVAAAANDSPGFGSHGMTLTRKMIAERTNLWQSSGIMMMRVIPYGAFTYCFFDILQVFAERLLYSHTPTVATNFVAGATAAATSTVIVYPLDVLRTRAAMNTLPSAPTVYWQFIEIVRRRGALSMYKGCSIAVLGIGLLGGIGFAAYEELKDRYHCDTFGKRLAAGMFSGMVAQAVAYPMNVVKRQRQVEQLVYSRMGEFKSIFLRPGIYASMYRKLPFSRAIGAMTFGISFAVNDLCRDVVVQAHRDMPF